MLTVNRVVNSGGFEYIGLIICFYSEGTGTTYMIFPDMHLRMYYKNQKMIFRVLNCMLNPESRQHLMITGKNGSGKTSLPGV